CGEDRRTYKEAAATAATLAGALAAAGVDPGDRVAFLVPNRMERIDLFFACARLGAVQVPLNTFLKGEFLRYQLADSGAATAVVDGPGLAAVAPLLPELPGLRRLIVLYDDAGDGPAPAVPAGVEVIRFAELDAPGRTTSPSDQPELPRPEPSDLAAIVYTSGTTGPSKGCRINQGYYVHIGAAWQAALELRADDVYFTAFPLFHLSGQALALMATLHRGATLILEPAFSASTFMERAGSVGATVVMGVGAMAQAVLATPPSPSDRAHSVRLCSWIPLPEARQLEFEERFGTAVSAEGYGQTECAPVTFSPASGERRRATAGRPAPWLDVRIVDEDDVEVASGEVGEIVVRPLEPDSLFSGYWGRDAETVATFRNLWHHTGDYGRMDAEGFVTFVDRKKDALRRRGENVSSMELEAAILRHPRVTEVAVHAVESEATEDDIKACVVAAPGEAEVTPGELFGFFAEHLPYFAVPRYVELVPELPKNALGRVLKHELRARGVTPATWDFEKLGLTVERDRRRGGG
ncbi:MAG TPA: AMP-binding protein, partial [Acidimicrobiia bacterium]|nr:AMP-binding protein [Acidimicrobiia bacterium]